MKDNIEWLLQQENREKRKTGNGVYHRASRTHKHDIVRMPSESLKGFKKRVITYP